MTPERLDPLGLATRAGLSRQALEAAIDSGLFDERFYLMTYPDIAAATINPLEHYLVHGRFERRKPSAIFDPSAYLEANPDVAGSGLDPFLHYVLVGEAAAAPLSRAETVPPRPTLTREIASGTTRLIVFLTPGFEARSGGVLSIAAIYRESGSLFDLHRAKVALCAVPGDDPLFVKYSWFENTHYLLDLTSLLRSCAHLDHLLLHIPEYAVSRMTQWLDGVSSSLLRRVREIHLNILVQNIALIEGQSLADLTRFGTVTATTAHEAYGNEATRAMLGVPVHKLGVCTGPELYRRSSYPDKQPILVVSHDPHPLKARVLQLIARAHPRLAVHVVDNMSYEDYKALVSRAKWALTFGEGLDNYFMETIFSGGNAFAVFDDRFFTPAFATLETVYPSWGAVEERLPADLRRLDEPTAYERARGPAFDLLVALYSTDRFRDNLRAFYRGAYTFP